MPQEDSLLGRIALHYKLVTQEQLTAATARQVATSRPLGDTFLELKLITADQLKWLQNAAAQYLAKNPAAAPAASAPPRPSAASTSPRTGSAPALAPAPTRTGQAPALTPAAGAPAAAPGALLPRPVPTSSAPLATAPRPVPTSSPSGFAVAKNEGLTDFTGAAAQTMRTQYPSLAQILAKAVESKASDVHIHAGAPLLMRLNGQLRELRTGVLTAPAVEFILKDALAEDERAFLNQNFDFDTALVLPEVGRFRASFYRQQRGWDAVFRPIAAEPPTLEQLGLPPLLKKVTEYHQGLVLITGPAGCGKSSTLAALVSMLNQSRADHIITVEDPIEYVHRPQGCLVNQRQAGKHTKTFANALRAALREDPDIIIIGELRDLETISLAITAAETGHLVMGTLHTNNAIRTINRVLDVFPPAQQGQIRAMVSESLRAIISQRLLPAADGTKRVPALETLFLKPSIANLIREEKTFQIRSAMQTGRADGTMLLDDSLLELVKSGVVTKEVARRAAEDPKRFA